MFARAPLHSTTESKTLEPEHASPRRALRWRHSTRRESLSLCQLHSKRRWKMRAARIIAASLALLVTTIPLSGQGRRPGSTRQNVGLYARLLAMTDSRAFDEALVDSALLSGWAPLQA